MWFMISLKVVKRFDTIHLQMITNTWKKVR